MRPGIRPVAMPGPFVGAASLLGHREMAMCPGGMPLQASSCDMPTDKRADGLLVTYECSASRSAHARVLWARQVAAGGKVHVCEADLQFNAVDAAANECHLFKVACTTCMDLWRERFLR